MSAEDMHGFSGNPAAICRRSIAEIRRGEAQRFNTVATALANAEHIPPERKAAYLRIITEHPRRLVPKTLDNPKRFRIFRRGKHL